MRISTKFYVTGVVAIALVVSAVLYAAYPEVQKGSAGTTALLCALAATAELLAFLVSGSATGSIAFIPYLATALVVPSWTSLLAVSLVKGITEAKVREPIKAVFNVAQHGLAFALAVLIYRLLGGQSLSSLQTLSLAETTRLVGVPALIAFVVSFAANSAIVTGVIAVNSGRRVVTIWRETFLATIGLDLLAVPLVFVFAWVCVKFGPLAAATLWVPILGLRQVHKANLQLEQRNRELLELMVKSIEARDPYTSGHSRRVQHYSVLIARALGLPERQIERIGQAALLHDIGKIHEKYAPILRKPDRLTPEEWRVMQEHPIDGASLIATMSDMTDIAKAIRHHHENWDGTGYPDGVAGELIPLTARVIMFADTIDAMTTERPYRKPLTPAEVRAELVRCRGRQFDPAITDRLLTSSMWDRIFRPTATPARVASPVKGTLRIVGGLRQAITGEQRASGDR